MIAKRCEKLVFNQLIGYLDENDLLTQPQFGLESQPWLHFSIPLITAWLVNIDESLITEVLFLDLLIRLIIKFSLVKLNYMV